MAHENLNREQEIEGSSDRTFGFVFAAFFLIIAAWPLLSRAGFRWWAGAIAAAFLLVALARPQLLAGLNRQWMRFGVFLGHIVSPIALGILFYLVLTPLALVMRLAGKDPLRLRFERGAASYWIERKPPGPPPDSMTNQF